jgi:tRNA pseudouridine32 synthase/23S rRNA pseudouridine746 synthase
VSLPRTPEVEAIAHGLMQQLQDACLTQEGKMYGVLLVATADGERFVLKAFSGLLNGQREVEGWVPPVPGREQGVAAEQRILATLNDIRQRLWQAQQRPELQQYADWKAEYDVRLQQLSQQHRQRKQIRQQQRQQALEMLTGSELAIALENLNEQSRRDGLERRYLKRERDAAGRSLQEQVEVIQAEIRQLKQERKHLSQQLQAQIHQTYRILNFAGVAQSLPDLVPSGLPSGTGDCCAPKLLHYAAQHQLRPLALAEFWWGAAAGQGDRLAGAFYGACAERCQPIMGFLLSGLATVEILYQDEALIVVNKPAGLLSVPGRTSDRADSVVTRLRGLVSHQAVLPVHRLDQETSGLLLLATDAEIYRALQRQFQKRQVRKVYEAVLAGSLLQAQGVIDLPLASDPGDRPRQRVDWQRGKSSLTHFRVLTRMEHCTRVELEPHTGRTHQLRVHAADPQGLGIPILGDRLYGDRHEGDRHETAPERLHLHARELSLTHPVTGTGVHFEAETPF